MKEVNLNKEFVCGTSTISRMDYESMSCPMDTSSLTDKDMQTLVEAIERQTTDWRQMLEEKDIDQEDYEMEWWRIAEELALEWGMTYYES